MKNLISYTVVTLLIGYISLFSGLFTSLHAQSIESMPCVDRTFQVYVHVSQEPDGTLPDELADIPAAFDSLNTIFEPICVRFQVCNTDTMENFHFDNINSAIEMEGLEMRNTNQELDRINFYYVRQLQSMEFGANMGGINSVDTSVIVLSHNGEGMVDIRQLAHEMGMFFGLPHTHDEQNGTELVSRTNCSIAGDGFCDTPADLLNLNAECGAQALPCRSICTTTDANGDRYAPDFSNYMSNYGDCRSRFTREQYIHMAETYLDGPKDQW